MLVFLFLEEREIYIKNTDLTVDHMLPDWLVRGVD
jgi:hypothetical protein